MSDVTKKSVIKNLDDLAEITLGEIFENKLLVLDAINRIIPEADRKSFSSYSFGSAL